MAVRLHALSCLTVLMSECAYNALINDEVNYAKLCMFTQNLTRKVVGLGRALRCNAIKMNDHRVNVQFMLELDVQAV